MKKNTPSGTTLLELLIVMMLFNVLLAGIYALYKVSVESWDVGLTRMETISGGRTALQKMIWELSTARKDSFFPPFPMEDLPLSTKTLSFTNDKNETIVFYNKEHTQEQPLRVSSTMMRANAAQEQNPDEGEGAPLGAGAVSFNLKWTGMVEITVAQNETGETAEAKIVPRN